MVTEHRNHTIADISLQMLSKGRQLADALQVELVAVIIGKDVGAHAEELTGWADRVLAVKNDRLEKSLAEPYQETLLPLIREKKPQVVLIGHNSFGMELAPPLSVALGVPLATDCTDVFLRDGSIFIRRSIYSGKINAVYSFAPGETVIITGRVGEFPVEEGNRQGQVEEIALSLDMDFNRKKFEGDIEQETGGVDITQSEVLVSVGRGIKEKENIEMVEKLAELLGGVVSCSRPVVDYGWLPPERQVGLSGKTVQPKLYLALGISGAFQHAVGMKGARMTVAVNRDARAPIFNVANYGIVGDIFDLVPELVRKISELKGNAG